MRWINWRAIAVVAVGAGLVWIYLRPDHDSSIQMRALPSAKSLRQSDRIAFTARDVYLLTRDDIRRVTRLPDTDEDLAINSISVSPGGAYLAYTRGSETDDDNDVWIADLVTGTRRRLTHIETVLSSSTLSWSPQGSEVAFAARVPFAFGINDPAKIRRLLRTETQRFKKGIFGPDPAQIFAVRVDGGALRQLTQGLTNKTDPAWSPDGRRVAYAKTIRAERQFVLSQKRDPPPRETRELWTARADGTQAHRLIRSRGDYSDLQWGRDGTSLSLTRTTGSVFSAGFTTTPLRLALPQGRFFKMPSAVTGAARSPEGFRIVFVRDDNLYIARVVNGKIRAPKPVLHAVLRGGDGKIHSILSGTVSWGGA